MAGQPYGDHGSYTGFYFIAGLAAVGLLVAVGASLGQGDETPGPSPTPMVTGVQQATQGPQTTYPDCRDTAERPCVEWAEDYAWLVTETGARLPVITVSRSTGRPRMITIK